MHSSFTRATLAAVVLFTGCAGDDGTTATTTDAGSTAAGDDGASSTNSSSSSSSSTADGESSSVSVSDTSTATGPDTGTSAAETTSASEGSSGSSDEGTTGGGDCLPGDDALEYDEDGCLTFAGASTLCGFSSTEIVCDQALTCGIDDDTSQCKINCEMGATIMCYDASAVACLRAAACGGTCDELAACDWIL